MTHSFLARRIVWFFVAAFCFYAAFAPMGQFPSDAAYNIETARSIWLRGSTSIEPKGPLTPKLGRDGRYYSKYGLLNALIFVPSVAGGNLAHLIFRSSEETATRGFLSFTNTFFAAGCLSLMFLIFLRLGYAERIALFCTCIIGCGSLLLPYSKIVFAETPTAFLLLLFFAWLSGRRGPLSKGDGAYLGLICILLLWLKIANGVDCLIIGGYVFFKLLKKETHLKQIAIFICINIASAGVMLWFNWIRFGTLWNSGYGGESFEFNASLRESISGLLFSPSHSILVNAPLIILALIGMAPFFRKHPRFAACAALLVTANFFFYAKWHDWKGGWGWGPRLLVPALIVMHFFLIDFVASLRGRIGRKLLIGALFPLALAVNLLGALVWYQQVHMISDDMWSIRRSHPAIAGKLFIQKLQGKPEVYAASEFGVANQLPGQRPQDDLDFRNYETFRGLALLWNGMAHYGKWRFALVVPWVLLLLSVLIVLRLREECNPLKHSPLRAERGGRRPG